MRFWGNIFKISLIVIAAFLAEIFTACNSENERIEKYASGKIQSKTTFKDGKKEGTQIEYFENGNIKRKANYVNGKRVGLVTEYFENGNIAAEYNYVDDLIDGSVTHYYKTGKILSKEIYKQNKLSAFGEYFDVYGDFATSGSYKDPRDGYKYEWVLINNQLWIAENINYATVNGSVCMQCNNWGRLYNFNAAKEACPSGFHIPSKSEWQQLLKFSSKNKLAGKALKAGFGWDPLKGTSTYGNGDDDFGFGVKAGGAHFAKSDVSLNNRKFADAGQKAYFWTAEKSVIVFFYNNDNAKFENFNAEFGASLRCLKD